MTLDFETFDNQIEKALKGNQRFIEDLFLCDEDTMNAMLQQSVSEGWRTQEQADSEMAEYHAHQREVGREIGKAIHTSPHFYE